MTEWIKERRTALLTTYAALNDGKNAVDEAKQILADDPKDFTALVLHHALHPAAVRAEPDAGHSRSDGEKAAKAILENLDTPPPNVAADQWAKLRPAGGADGAQESRFYRDAAQELGRGGSRAPEGFDVDSERRHGGLPNGHGDRVGEEAGQVAGGHVLFRARGHLDRDQARCPPRGKQTGA